MVSFSIKSVWSLFFSYYQKYHESIALLQGKQSSMIWNSPDTFWRTFEDFFLQCSKLFYLVLYRISKVVNHFRGVFHSTYIHSTRLQNSDDCLTNECKMTTINNLLKTWLLYLLQNLNEIKETTKRWQLSVSVDIAKHGYIAKKIWPNYLAKKLEFKLLSIAERIFEVLIQKMCYFSICVCARGQSYGEKETHYGQLHWYIY